jgi:cell division septation protein DedD
MDSEVRREARFAWLKTVGLAAVGMGVVLIAGGLAFTSPRGRSVVASAGVPAIAQAGMSSTAQAAAPAEAAAASAAVPETQAPALATVPLSAASAASQNPWVVQVAAFSTQARAEGLVQRLRQSGFPAFEVPSQTELQGLLYFVRVGPFKTASEADEARDSIRQLSDLEDAFVRSVTTPAP